MEHIITTLVINSQQQNHQQGYLDYIRFGDNGRMDFPNNIAAIAKAKGIKQAALARRMGKPAQEVERFWNGKRKLDAVWIALFADALNCSKGDILSDKEEKTSPYIEIPAYDVKFAAGHGSLVEEENIKHYASFRKEWIKQVTNAGKDKLCIVYAEGDSMEPTLENGDAVLLDTTQTTLTKEGIYAIQFDGHGMIKRLQFNPVTKAIKIISDNPKYESFEAKGKEPFKIIGRAIWAGGKL
jgi:phage repressor protein C with HTH and peptisase S24 domain